MTKRKTSKALIKLEYKSKLSSDDWRELGRMMNKLREQERSWLDDIEEKQERKRDAVIIGSFYSDMTLKEVKAIFKSDDILFIARDPATSKPVGFCAVERKDDLGWSSCDGIYVDESWRNQGIASAFLEMALQKTRDSGLFSMDLRVSVKNKTARKLYEKLGFSKTAYMMERWVF